MHLQPLRSGGQRSVPPSAARSRCRVVSARCYGLPSPPAPLPQRGRGVIVALASLTDFDAESPLLRLSSPFLSRSAGEEGGWGEGEGHQAYSAAPTTIFVSLASLINSLGFRSCSET